MPDLDSIVSSLAHRSDSLPLAEYGAPSPKLYDLVSVDDHLVEPVHIFEGRMPARFANSGPRVVKDEMDRDVWLFQDTIVPIWIHHRKTREG